MSSYSVWRDQAGQQQVSVSPVATLLLGGSSMNPVIGTVIQAGRCGAMGVFSQA